MISEINFWGRLPTKFENPFCSLLDTIRLDLLTGHSSKLYLFCNYL
jgi:hypothetical protein